MGDMGNLDHLKGWPIQGYSIYHDRVILPPDIGIGANKMSDEPKKTGLELLRVPFPDNLINKLPKGTKAQNDCPASEKVNCKECGGWHHPKIVHLDYVGHAALTDRLLDADPLWTWEPLALHDGLPAFDATGGLWIKLTVCGHSRLGYGHAPASNFKEIGSREKEVIGDALRNAAMRFGAALDLWHKGDLHIEDHSEEEKKKPIPPKPGNPPLPPPASPQDAEYQGRIRMALHALYGDDKAAALAKVEEMTSFIPKGKTEAEKVKGIRDFTKISGQRLSILCHNLEKLVPPPPLDTPPYGKECLCQECGEMQIKGACRALLCPEAKPY
jgi:hypothetical protein